MMCVNILGSNRLILLLFYFVFVSVFFRRLSLKLLDYYGFFYFCFSPGEYVRAFRQKPDDPLITLCLGLQYVHLACQRFPRNRHSCVVQVRVLAWIETHSKKYNLFFLIICDHETIFFRRESSFYFNILVYVVNARKRITTLDAPSINWVSLTLFSRLNCLQRSWVSFYLLPFLFQGSFNSRCTIVIKR